MKRILLAVSVAVFTTAAAADHTSWFGNLGNGNSVRLYHTPCAEPKVIRHLQPGAEAKLTRAVVAWQGKALEACWMGDPANKLVFVVDETGDAGVLPARIFERQASV